jgi:branched-chain amino acid transport system substrate-binding protein
MKIRHCHIYLAVLAAWPLLAGCNKSSPGSSAESSTIKVGEYASLTGSEATFGQQSHNGTELAVEEINAAGGVLGKKIDLLT